MVVTYFNRCCVTYSKLIKYIVSYYECVLKC